MRYLVSDGLPGHRFVLEGEMTDEALDLAGQRHDPSEHSRADRIRLLGAALINECLPLRASSHQAIQHFGSVAIEHVMDAIASAIEGLTRRPPEAPS
jgi:hypothetical protein